MYREIASSLVRCGAVAIALGAGVAAAAALPGSNLIVSPAVSTVSMAGLHVVGNQIQNGAGVNLFLHGANRSGTEFECVRGTSSTLKSSSAQAYVNVLKSWNINATRVPLNEDCWLGINTNASNAATMGAAYRQAIVSYVNLLTSNNLVVILDLHWTAPGTTLATGQMAMPDADHAPAFWSSVATTFRGNSSVIFDLFNEPYPNFNWGPQSSSMAWQCWLNGGTSCSDPNINYTAAGMQSLLNAVRGAGAHNVVMAGGLQFANELSLWLNYKPSDPLNNLAAAWHMYAPNNYCSNTSCWNTYVAPVAAQVPIVAGEFGTQPSDLSTCSVAAPLEFWSFMARLKQGYIAWTFDAWGGDCNQGFNWSLISDDNGTPTRYGAAYFVHLLGLPSSYPKIP